MATAYCEIPITKGYVTLVDIDDYEDLVQFPWRADVKSHTVYACRSSRKIESANRVTWYIHRELLSDAAQVDHINHNGLDNRRHNLRPATYSQNLQNRRSRPGSSSRFVGVSWNAQVEKWLAFVTEPSPTGKGSGRLKNLGTYPDEVQAARIRDAAAKELYGEFASLNFPNEVAA